MSESETARTPSPPPPRVAGIAGAIMARHTDGGYRCALASSWRAGSGTWELLATGCALDDIDRCAPMVWAEQEIHAT